MIKVIVVMNFSIEKSNFYINLGKKRIENYTMVVEIIKPN